MTAQQKLKAALIEEEGKVRHAHEDFRRLPLGRVAACSMGQPS